MASSKSELEQCESQQPPTSNTITTMERLQIRCKPSYKPRRVKNKGAILVLMWNYLIMIVFGSLNQYLTKDHNLIIWIVFVLIPPTAGWLADAHIGKYNMICCSIWMMWIAAVLATVSSITAELVSMYGSIDTKVIMVLLFFMATGLGAYQPNIIQFGLDQLQDASTTEITSFIIWFIWTIESASLTTDYIFTCLSEHQNTIRNLLACSSLTLALILLICCNQWLSKEPACTNPFKHVYRVLKYAAKNKQPQHRSAFTYCEDELPSRIDFGKIKYGGPFTTEQVEDVKTFLRLIPVAIVGGVLAGLLFTTDYLRDKLYEVMADFDALQTKMTLKECYLEASFSHTIYYSSVVLIVLHEVLFYPVFHRCFPQIRSLQKVAVGMTLHITRVFALMVYIIAFHQTNRGQIQCLFKYNGQAQNKSFSHYWIAVPDFIHTLSVAMIFIGTAEFLCSQVPKYMMGITIGANYCSFFLSSGVWFLVSVPFTKNSTDWGTRTINCGFWLSLILAITQICICLFLIILARWYKKRRRQDVPPNEHIYAERYYSKKIETDAKVDAI